MTKKEVAALEQKICIVCGKCHDTGIILIDGHGRPIFSDDTVVTGYHLCEEHQKMFDEGYIALIEINPERSNLSEDGILEPKDVYRTGAVVHIKKSLADKLFEDQPEGFEDSPVRYVVPEVTQFLNGLKEKALAQQAQ